MHPLPISSLPSASTRVRQQYPLQRRHAHLRRSHGVFVRQSLDVHRDASARVFVRRVDVIPSRPLGSERARPRAFVRHATKEHLFLRFLSEQRRAPGVVASLRRVHGSTVSHESNQSIAPFNVAFGAFTARARLNRHTTRARRRARARACSRTSRAAHWRNRARGAQFRIRRRDASRARRVIPRSTLATTAEDARSERARCSARARAERSARAC